MTRDDISAMGLSDDARTFPLVAEFINPQDGEQANLCVDAPFAFDILEAHHFSEGASGGWWNALIDSAEVLFEDSETNGVPFNTGVPTTSDVVGSEFTVGEGQTLQVQVELPPTGTTKLVVQLTCRRSIVESIVT